MLFSIDVLHILHVDCLLAWIYFFVKFFLEGFDPLNVTLNFVLLVDLECLIELTSHLVLKSSLVLVEVELPAIEVRQLQISNMIDLQQSVKVLVNVEVVLLLEDLLGEVSYLSQTLQPRGLARCCFLSLLLLVELNQVECHHVLANMRNALAIIKNVLLIGANADEASLVHHSNRHVFQGQPEIQELDCVEEVLVLWVGTALTVESCQLVFADLLLQQQIWIQQAQINQLRSTTQPYLRLLVIYAVVDQLESVVDPWRMGTLAETLLNNELLVVGLNLCQ